MPSQKKGSPRGRVPKEISDFVILQDKVNKNLKRLCFLSVSTLGTDIHIIAQKVAQEMKLMSHAMDLDHWAKKKPEQNIYLRIV